MRQTGIPPETVLKKFGQFERYDTPLHVPWVLKKNLEVIRRKTFRQPGAIIRMFRQDLHRAAQITAPANPNAAVSQRARIVPLMVMMRSPLVAAGAGG